MTGHGPLRQPEGLSQVHYASLTIGEMADDRQPVAVCEAVEQGCAPPKSNVGLARCH